MNSSPSTSMASASSLRMLAIACLLASRISSTLALRSAKSPADVLRLLQRDSLTCARSSDSSCTSVDANLPGNFCCSSGETCISLDNSSSALCCPSGQDCSTITTISCDVSAQDVDQHPGAPIHTTKLNSKLPTCGTNCCPFGYTCQLDSDGNGTCSIIADLSSLAPGFSSSQSSSSSPSATSSSTATSATLPAIATTTTTSVPSTTSSSAANTSTPSGIDSTIPLPASQCPRFPGTAIVAGFFPGMLAGALLTLILVLCCSSRTHSRPSSRSSADYKPQIHRGRSQDGRIVEISNPIPFDSSQSTRTDFIRRTTTRARSFFSPNTTTSPESHWKMPTPPVPNNIPLYPVARRIPVTPERQVKSPTYHQQSTNNSGDSSISAKITKEPSLESIRVYSPPSMAQPPVPYGLPASITPLRGMATQRLPGAPRESPSSADAAPIMSSIGSPFKTPTPGRTKQSPKNTKTSKNLYVFPESDYGDESVGDGMNRGETLTPARYEGGRKNDTSNNNGRDKAAEFTRPTTTFTEMLAGIDFPDPGRTIPPVPGMPRSTADSRWR